MDAMDTDMPVTAPDASAALSLDPWDYNERIRKVQAEMLAGDDAVREAQVPVLLEAYAAKAAVMALTPIEWHIYLGTAYHHVDMDSWIALHAQSTRDALDISLFVRHASLLLRVYEAHAGVVCELDPHAPLSDAQGKPWALASLTEEWTGRRGPPLHDHGLYDPSCVLPGAPALSREEVRGLLRELYGRCAWHASESQVVWQMYLAFETIDASDASTDLLHQVYVARLQIPHRRTLTYSHRIVDDI